MAWRFFRNKENITLNNLQVCGYEFVTMQAALCTASSTILRYIKLIIPNTGIYYY